MAEKERYIPGYLQRKEQHFHILNKLLILTIIFNICRGFISISFGILENSITLIGFGIEAFIELAYSSVIWNLIQRVSEGYPDTVRESEESALKAGSVLYYILALGIAIFGIVRIVSDSKPDTASWGIIISIVSFAIMFVISSIKTNVGLKLKSQTVLDDANYGKISMAIAIILLISSLGSQFTKTGIFDSVGALLLAAALFFKGYSTTQKLSKDTE